MNFLKNLFGNSELMPLNYICSVKCTCNCATLDEVVNNEPGTHPNSHTVSGTKKP